MGALRARRPAALSALCAQAHQPTERQRSSALADLSEFLGSGEKAQVLKVEGDEQHSIATFLAGGLPPRSGHGDRGGPYGGY